ncbi:MAG: hypothetical protein NDI94_02335 [Candidatus Woesearchaeota archaeon]|nr:hypothetical protein [Candidatus Woesearchaeota archaeon]
MAQVMDADALLESMQANYPDISPFINPNRNGVQTHVFLKSLSLLYELMAQGKIDLDQLPKGSCVDAGCGRGYLLPALKTEERLLEILGDRQWYMLDIDKDAVKEAKVVVDTVTGNHPELKGKWHVETPCNLAAFHPYKAQIEIIKDLPILEKIAAKYYGNPTQAKYYADMDRIPVAFGISNQTLHWLSDAEKLEFLIALRFASMPEAIFGGNISAVGSGMPLIPAYIKTVLNTGEYDFMENPLGFAHDALNMNPIGSTDETLVKKLLDASGWEVLGIKAEKTTPTFKDPREYFLAAKTYGAHAFLKPFPLRHSKVMEIFWERFEANFMEMVQNDPNDYQSYVPRGIRNTELGRWNVWTPGNDWHYNQWDIHFWGKVKPYSSGNFTDFRSHMEQLGYHLNDK